LSHNAHTTAATTLIAGGTMLAMSHFFVRLCLMASSTKQLALQKFLRNSLISPRPYPMRHFLSRINVIKLQLLCAAASFAATTEFPHPRRALCRNVFTLEFLLLPLITIGHRASSFPRANDKARDARGLRGKLSSLG